MTFHWCQVGGGGDGSQPKWLSILEHRNFKKPLSFGFFYEIYPPFHTIYYDLIHTQYPNCPRSKHILSCLNKKHTFHGNCLISPPFCVYTVPQFNFEPPIPQGNLFKHTMPRLSWAAPPGYQGHHNCLVLTISMEINERNYSNAREQF